jgi:hypothetical protein
MPVIPALERQRQESCKFQACPGYKANSRLPCDTQKDPKTKQNHHHQHKNKTNKQTKQEPGM